jgi:hypothetical protein
MKGKSSRRDFIKTASIGASAVAITSRTANEAKTISPISVPKWDYEADAVILGTGFSGQVSAIVAHDAGATIPMIEKAQEKHQGGNSKVCGQLIWCPSEAIMEDAFQYLKAMTAGTGYPVPEEYLRFYVKGRPGAWKNHKSHFYNETTLLRSQPDPQCHQYTGRYVKEHRRPGDQCFWSIYSEIICRR